MLLEQLQAGGYAVTGSYAYNDALMVVPVVIQCFEANTLIYLRDKTDIPLVTQMLGIYAHLQLLTPALSYRCI